MNKYNEEAKKFLSDFNLILSIREAVPQTKPLWIDTDKKNAIHGKDYSCSLSSGDGRAYCFHFWDSIANLETGKGPTAYDVLACLDTYAEGESFEYFCNSYGYDTDSIKAEKTYEAVMKQVRGLKNTLSSRAIEALNNIN